MARTFAYCRVSTLGQTAENQIQAELLLNGLLQLLRRPESHLLAGRNLNGFASRRITAPPRFPVLYFQRKLPRAGILIRLPFFKWSVTQVIIADMRA